MGLFDTLKGYLDQERLIATATIVGASASATVAVGAKFIVHPNGQTEGEFPADELRAAIVRDAVRAQRREDSVRHTYDAALAGGEPGEVIDVFIEVYAPSPHLILFGGDHIAIPLTHYAKELGFRVTIVDARSRFANRERFPEADEIIVAWPDKAFAQLHVDFATYIAILSHDPKLDEPATRGALQTDARYIGAIGARKTHIDRRARLSREGFTDEQINRIHGPIGLDLGGKTPPEIALSIIAEVVATRYDRHLVSAQQHEEARQESEAERTLEALEEVVEVAGD
ncbi:MAG TPA: XdhC/CoxI family protein [Thermomicrobiales bacterium]|jgi:xanthine dehydrogenase accessory factor